jgi:SGNH hydrolase-like domain, acetyltransferase AlgX
MRWFATVLLVAVAVVAWVVAFDDSTKGAAVLGGYRDGPFLFCVFLSYLALVVGLALLAKLGRRTWLRIALVHFGVLLPVGLAEAVAGLHWISFEGMRAVSAPRRLQPSGVDANVRWAALPNVDIEGETYPDLVALLGARSPRLPFSYQTDANGLRNSRAKPDARVHCIGDSILVAGLVPSDETVTSLLEPRLGVVVQNVSEVGYSPQEAIFRLQGLQQDLRERLVVQFFFEGNDLGDSRSWRRWRGKPRSSRNRTRGLIKTLTRMLDGPKRAAGRRRLGSFAGSDGPVDVYFSYDATSMDADLDQFSAICSAFRDVRAGLAARRSVYAVVFVPAKLTVLHRYCKWGPESELAAPRHGRTRIRGRLRGFCAAEGIPFRDVTDPLQALAAGGELPYFAADSHLNAAGHAVMAAALADWMKSLLPN